MGGITGLQVLSTDISGILNYWGEIGVFQYVLPFLLIFAVVYGILSKTKILEEHPDKNKGVNAVIAVAIGLLSLQWDYVPNFFARIFPFAGVGISILLVAMILMGLFFNANSTTDSWQKNTFFGIGAVIAIAVVLTSFSDVGVGPDFIPGWWGQYGPALITLITIAVLIALVVGNKKGSNSTPATG